MALSFLKAVRDEFPRALLQVIVPKQYSPVLDLVPFEIMSYSFDETEYEGALGMYKYCSHMVEIFEIDIFFTLQNSFNTNLIGKFCSAKESVGFSSGNLRDMLLTKNMPPLKRIHKSEEYLKLLEVYTESKPLQEKIICREVAPPFQDWESNRYVVINLFSEWQSKIMPLKKWVKLFDFFKDVRFVFIGKEEFKQKITEFIEELEDKYPDKNTYLNIAGNLSFESLAKTFAFAQGMISNDSGIAHFAGFCGTPLIITMGASDPKRYGYSYIKPRNLEVTKSMECAPCNSSTCKRESIECLEQIDFQEMVDFAYDIFSLHFEDDYGTSEESEPSPN